MVCTISCDDTLGITSLSQFCVLSFFSFKIFSHAFAKPSVVFGGFYTKMRSKLSFNHPAGNSAIKDIKIGALFKLTGTECTINNKVLHCTLHLVGKVLSVKKYQQKYGSARSLKYVVYALLYYNYCWN